MLSLMINTFSPNLTLHVSALLLDKPQRLEIIPRSVKSISSICTRSSSHVGRPQAVAKERKCMGVGKRANDTILLTDASRLHGLGYALVQKSRKGELSLIQCGSRSLTPTQQRYATIELECLAIVWAKQKCDYYL